MAKRKRRSSGSFAQAVREMARETQRTNRLLIGVVLFFAISLVAFAKYSATEGGTGGAAVPTTTTVEATGCPTDGVTTIKLVVKNGLNTSTEYLAQTWEVYDENGENVGSITTNAGSTKSFASINVNCPGIYYLYPVTDDDAGSVIKGILKARENELVQEFTDSEGKKIATVSADANYIEVRADRDTISFTAVVDKHSDDIKVLMYDEQLAGWVYAASQTSATTEQTVSDGGTVTFYTTTSNSTDLAVGQGGTVKMRIDIDAGSSFENANDRGIVMAIDVGTEKTKWEEGSMIVKVNGQELKEVGASGLTPEEQDRFNGNEWFYIIPADVAIKGSDVKIYIEMKAKSDQNPTADITITLGVRGQYKTVNEAMAISAAKDDSSNSKVVSEWTIVRAIS